ncbi:hypothetical protein CH289_17405 [Rhodococcus sp. RS1C4]|nr:hypothetical protein CH289_17405 [Rhodococcus sp. RS1C4]
MEPDRGDTGVVNEALDEHLIELLNIHYENSAVMRRSLLSPAGFLSAAHQTFSGPKVAVRGECRRLAHYAEGKGIWLTLSVLEGGSRRDVEAHISPKASPIIARFLKNRCDVTLADHLAVGHELTLGGEMVLQAHTGKLFLEVDKVGARFALVGGFTTTMLQHRTEMVRLGASRHRMSDNLSHHSGYSPTDIPWPKPFSNMVVITSRNSLGAEDMLRQLSKRHRGFRCVVDESVTVEGRLAPKSIVEAIRRHTEAGAQLIMLIRGGGSGQGLAAFDDPVLGACILNSTVPVFTGLGHAQDISLADRAAKASFDTPTAAGNAVDKHLWTTGKATRQAAAEIKSKRSTAQQNRAKVTEAVAHAQTLRELDRAHAERVRLQAEMKEMSDGVLHWVNRYHAALHVTAYQRLLLRSRAFGSAFLTLAGIAALFMSVGMAPAGYGYGVLAVLLPAATYVLRGPHRALQPVSLPTRLDRADWYAKALTVKTPRQYRTVWPNWPKPQ